MMRKSRWIEMAKIDRRKDNENIIMALSMEDGYEVSAIK